MEIVPIDPVFNVNERYCGSPGSPTAYGGKTQTGRFKYQGVYIGQPLVRRCAYNTSYLYKYQVSVFYVLVIIAKYYQ